MRSEKGFISLIIVIIVAATILGGGVLFYRSQRSVPQPQIQTPSAPEIEPQKKRGVIPEVTIIQKTLEKKPAPAPAPAQKVYESKPAAPPPVFSPTESQIEKNQPVRDSWKDPVPAAPTDLFLPILVKDINVTVTMLSPYGIIRKSGDGGIGHGGIDFPLERSSPVYAVADGTIIKNYLEDVGGGNTVDVLILGEYLGEGWIFKYDHIALETGLSVWSAVKRGQKIGTNAFQQRGNNHIGLEYHIKNFTIAREKICWVELLESTAKKQLEDAFEVMKKIPAFIEAWQTANAEGYYQYKGLLDETKYPNGPQLCYPLGTDARIPM